MSLFICPECGEPRRWRLLLVALVVIGLATAGAHSCSTTTTTQGERS